MVNKLFELSVVYRVMEEVGKEHSFQYGGKTIGGIHITKLTKNIDVSYAYVSKLVKELQVSGFVTTTKIGKWAVISITEKGKSLNEHVKSIHEITDLEVTP